MVKPTDSSPPSTTYYEKACSTVASASSKIMRLIEKTDLVYTALAVSSAVLTISALEETRSFNRMGPFNGFNDKTPWLLIGGVIATTAAAVCRETKAAAGDFIKATGIYALTGFTRALMLKQLPLYI